MTTVLLILAVQGLIGALDNLLHHELRTRLPERISARRELAFHSGREFLYGVLFLGLAWAEWHGLWAYGLAAILAAEIVITMTDFLEEDASRRLPRFERILHTALAVGYGAFLMAFAPVLLGWAGQPTAVVPATYGVLSWLLTVYALGVWGWSLRNALASRRLFRERAALSAEAQRAEEEAGAAAGARRETVLVTGGTGLIGTALVADLLRNGKRVIVLTRDPRQVTAAYGRRVLAVDHPDLLPAETRIDAVVNLAGASIAGGLWTRARKRTLLESRLSVTRDLTRFMASLTRPPKVLISASAVGFYGARGQEVVDEKATPQPVFMSRLCQDWERMAMTARAAGTRVVILRFGVVLSRRGGLLPPLALAARLGLGAVLGSGRQMLPWIHVDDAVGLIRFAQEASALSGPVNAVAPDPVTQRDFVARLAAHVHRRVHLTVPASWLRALTGELSQLFLEGQNADPGKLLRAGYRYRFATLEAALGDLIPARRSVKERRTRREREKRPGREFGRADKVMRQE